MGISIVWVLFIVAILLELIYTLLFVLTIKKPPFRYWPPPSIWSWQFLLAWLMVAVVVVCGLWLGFYTLDSGPLPDINLRLPFAVILFALGCGIGGWGDISLGMRATMGLGDKLVTSGPYQYTRNPQYLGDILITIGFMIMTNSWMVWVIGILGVVLNILAPFTEEPWLETRYGESFRQYMRQVPRFMGRWSKNIC
jgi:protein-S-isoprenylcysteine O-methyltransferase Ste14